MAPSTTAMLSEYLLADGQTEQGGKSPTGLAMGPAVELLCLYLPLIMGCCGK